MARAGLDRRLARLEAGRLGDRPLLVVWEDLDDPDLFYTHNPRPAGDPAGGRSYRRAELGELGQSYRVILVTYERSPTHDDMLPRRD
jgi:hypothetical protein